ALPWRRVGGRRGGGGADHRDQALAVEMDPGQRDAAELGDRRQPVAAVGDLIADLALRQVPRPTDDRRHANAALEQAELGPAIDPRTAAAEVGALLGRVP